MLNELATYLQIASGFSDSPKVFGAILFAIFMWIVPSLIALVLRKLGKVKAAEAFEAIATSVHGFLIRMFQALVNAGPVARATIVYFTVWAAVGAAQGCALFKPSVTSPCPNLYCIRVDVGGLPGAPELCYSTEAAMLQAKGAYEAQGKKVTVVK
jgi:hypothetical protein